MQWNKIFVLVFAIIGMEYSYAQKIVNMNKIVYVMDPHCGWCYGNSDNITELNDKYSDAVEFELLVGGMWIGDKAPKGGVEFQRFISNHSPRMEAITGAYVSNDFHYLTADSTYRFSSLEPAGAILLVKEIAPDKAFAFTKAVQKAIFVKGNRLDKLETYLPILKELKMDETQFKNNWMSDKNIIDCYSEFKKASSFASGFPTLVFDDGNEKKMLASGYFKIENVTKKIDDVLEK